MTIREEVKLRIERDTQLERIRKKIERGKASYTDTATYSIRAGKLTGEMLAQHLPEVPLDEREQLCVDLLHDRYIDINAAVDSAQKVMDEAKGLHLAPQRAPFNSERAQKIGSSIRDVSKDVETQKRRARAATETATKAMHDDRMEAEAKFRSGAGLKCYITRVSVGGCCKWCTKVAGRYEYGSEPEDIFRRHDNCDCTVTYENGRERQDVWSKKTWTVPEDAGAQEPVRFTQEQAASAGAEPPKVFTESEGRATEQRNLAQIRGLRINNSSIDNSSGNDIMSVVAEVASNAHSRDVELESIIERCIKQDKPVFADDLALNFSKIPHESGRFIVAMHGSPNEVMLYGRSANEKILANIIRSRKDYNNEDEIVLISCNTGNEAEVSKCFAQRLADEMGKTVHAPTRYGAIDFWGNYYSSDKNGKRREGEFKPFTPQKEG